MYVYVVVSFCGRRDPLRSGAVFTVFQKSLLPSLNFVSFGSPFFPSKICVNDINNVAVGLGHTQ